METLCSCKHPRAVNKCDERYHCDHCGYPLSPGDRRHAMLQVVGLETWLILAYRSRDYLNPERAWDSVERHLGSHDSWDWDPRHPPSRPPPPLRHIRFRFSAMQFPELFDPERE
jgi:hypothetical protein